MKIKNILVSQPKPDSEKSPYFDIIRNHKVHMEFKPFIKVEGVPAVEFRKQRIDLGEFKCIVLNSKNAVDHYFRMAQEMRYTVPEGNKYFCLTEAIALYLQKYIVYRKRKIFFAQLGIQELIEPFKKHREEKFLFPSSDKHSDKVTEFFNAHAIKYTQGVFFRTVSSDMTSVNMKDYDMLVFFTPAGIESLFENYPDFQQGETKIAIFGSSTYATAASKGLRVDLAAPLIQAPSMTMAIDLFLKECNSKNGIANLEVFGVANMKKQEPVVPVVEKKATTKVKKTVKKKKPVKKAPAKKAAAKKNTTAVKKKTAVKKTVVSGEKAAVKKPAAKKTATAKATPKKKTVTKAAPGKKAVTKKPAVTSKKTGVAKKGSEPKAG